MSKGLKIFFLALGGTIIGAVVFLGYFYPYRENPSTIKNTNVKTHNQFLDNANKEKEAASNSFESGKDNIVTPGQKALPEPKKSDLDHSLDPDGDPSLSKDSNKFNSDNDDEEETDDGVVVAVEPDDE